MKDLKTLNRQEFERIKYGMVIPIKCPNCLYVSELTGDETVVKLKQVTPERIAGLINVVTEEPRPKRHYRKRQPKTPTAPSTIHPASNGVHSGVSQRAIILDAMQKACKKDQITTKDVRTFVDVETTSRNMEKISSSNISNYFVNLQGKGFIKSVRLGSGVYKILKPLNSIKLQSAVQ
jgi:hypothetical protein